MLATLRLRNDRGELTTIPIEIDDMSVLVGVTGLDIDAQDKDGNINLRVETLATQQVPLVSLGWEANGAVHITKARGFRTTITTGLSMYHAAVLADLPAPMGTTSRDVIHGGLK
jgi:hypothetical protein